MAIIFKCVVPILILLIIRQYANANTVGQFRKLCTKCDKSKDYQ